MRRLAPPEAEPLAPWTPLSANSETSTLLYRQHAMRRLALNQNIAPIEWTIVGLMSLIVVTLTLVSPSLLTNLKIHYVSTSGPFYEKLHPATYLAVAAFGLLLLRAGDPIREIDRIASAAKLLLVFMFCWGLLFLQCIILRRPFTGIIDTFLLPVMFSVVAWSLTTAQKKPLLWTLHFVVWVNIAAGYYEYFSGHRIVPLMAGNVLVLGEWRSTAFLGTPLSASSFMALYVLTLVLRPELCRPLLLRIPAIVLSAGSLMAFGGRTALTSVLILFGCVAAVTAFRLLRGRRVTLPVVILTICAVILLAGAVLALYQHGTFDRMLNRFSSDKGSALDAPCKPTPTDVARLEGIGLRDRSIAQRRPAIVDGTTVWHRELLDRLHRSVWRDMHGPDHDRGGMLFCRAAAPL